jgi:hypothetical protein
MTVAACGPRVYGSSVATAPSALDRKAAIHPASPIALGATTIPPNATEVGTVQAASDDGRIDSVLPELLRQIAKLGGNFGKIDDVTTQFEVHMIPMTHTYSCGTASAPATCTSTTIQEVEVATTRILGRAFVVGP